MGAANRSFLDDIKEKPLLAEPGYQWVCLACGKTARHRHPGGDPSNQAGWDESCMLNCGYFAEEKCEYSNGRVVNIRGA